MKLKKIAASILALCLLFGVGAAATSWEGYDSATAMLKRADLVIVGTPTGTEDLYSVNAFGDSIPYTVTTIEVTEVIKGNAQVGGVFQDSRPNHRNPNPDDLIVEWPDIWLEVGQKYLLFLSSSDGLSGSMLNPMQGHYIVDDEGKLTAHPSNAVKIPSLDALHPNSVNFTLEGIPKKVDTKEILINAPVGSLADGSTVSDVFQKALTQAGYIYGLDDTGEVAIIAYSDGLGVFPPQGLSSNAQGLLHYFVNGAFVVPNAVVADGDEIIVSIMVLFADPPFGPYVGLFGKYTSYPSNFWNWFKFVALFGWAWMWFVDVRPILI